MKWLYKLDAWVATNLFRFKAWIMSKIIEREIRRQLKKHRMQ